MNYNLVDNANSKFGSASCDSLSRIFEVTNPPSCHFTEFLEGGFKANVVFVIKAFIIMGQAQKYFFKVEFCVDVLKQFKFAGFINNIYFKKQFKNIKHYIFNFLSKRVSITLWEGSQNLVKIFVEAVKFCKNRNI